MSTLPAVLRNTFVLLAGTTAAKALVFVSYLILARQLEPADFGRYSLVFAYLAFFELLPDAGLDPIAVRESAARPARMAAMMGHALAVRASLGLVVLALAIGVAPAGVGGTQAHLLVALGAITWVTSNRRASLRSVLDTPYRVTLSMGTPTALGVGSELLHVAILLPLIAADGLAGAVAAQGLAPIPFLVLLAWWTSRRVAPRIAWAPREWARLVRVAAPLLVGLLLNVMLVRSDVLMLQHLRGAIDVGLYAAPVRIVEIANLLPALLMASIFPLFAANHPGDPERVRRLFRTSLAALAIVLVPVVLVQSFAAGAIIRLCFGDAFAGAATALPWLAAAEVFVFADIVLTACFLATGREKRNVQCVAVAAVANVGLNLWAIPHWGAAGAAATTFAAYVVRAAMSFAFRDTRTAGLDTFAATFPSVVIGTTAAGAALLLADTPLARSLTALCLAAGLAVVFRRRLFGPLADAWRLARPRPGAPPAA